MTGPNGKAELPNIGAAVGADPTGDPSGLPIVLLDLTTGATTIRIRIDARQAPEFIAQVAQGVIAAAQQALAAAGPQIITPGAGGRLIVPGPTNGHRP